MTANAAQEEGRAALARVMVVDDHPMWREVVREDLEREGVAEVVAEAADGDEAVQLAQQMLPDVVLMDLNLPTISGVEAIRRIVSNSPSTRALVLSASAEETDVLEAVKAGAAGYVLKSSTATEVADAVRRVAKGEPVFTPSLAGLVLEEFRRLATHRPTTHVLPARESETLKLVAKGFSYREIAERLSVSPATVRHSMQNILTRLHLRHEDALLEEEGEGGSDPDRILATVLFTDLVGSTEMAVKIGDERWRDLVEAHIALVRRELVRFHGREVDTAGDGFLATFDQPTQAVRCAAAIAKSVARLGIEIRAGLHTGEIERVEDRVRGIAVHIGARIAAAAGAGEIFVSSTVRDLASGSGIRFDDRGERALKGVPGEWRLFAVDRGSLG
jgi:DNA-binding NarL/FixJ family response regulator